jgi:glycosyltransferase involved in cell wall biosynthesis
MKICIVNEFFKPHITGGAELFLQHLIDYLIEDGYEIKVITQQIGNEKVIERVGKLSIHRINSSPITIGHFKQIPGFTLPFNFFNLTLQKKLKEIIKDCDCVHVNNLYHLSFAPIQIANKLKKFTLLDVHDHWPICFNKKILYLNKKYCEERRPLKCIKCLMSTNTVSTISYPAFNYLVIFEYLLRKKYLKFNEVVAHSKFVGNLIREEFKKEPNIIPIPYFGKKMVNEARKLGKEINLLFVGRVNYDKGAHYLIPIAENLKKEGVSYKINVMGTGDMLEKLKNVSEKEKLNIVFHGFVENMSEKFLRIMKETNILISPFVWFGTFDIVALEAMAFGIPIIGSDRGGLKELVNENDIGVSVPLNAKVFSDEIVSLFNDKKRYERYSLNGIKNLGKYEQRKIFERYKKIFEKAV